MLLPSATPACVYACDVELVLPAVALRALFRRRCPAQRAAVPPARPWPRRPAPAAADGSLHDSGAIEVLPAPVMEMSCILSVGLDGGCFAQANRGTSNPTTATACCSWASGKDAMKPAPVVMLSCWPPSMGA